MFVVMKICLFMYSYKDLSFSLNVLKSVENNNCFYSFVHNLQKTSYSSNVVHAQYFLY